MARKPSIDESSLTKGELRKLNALRKSVGDDIAAKAFAEWFANKPEKAAAVSTDKTAEAIADAVMSLIERRKIKGLPRGGYVVKRGRGRVMVVPAGD
ncbi:MAG: hypothetical protein QF893_15305 [Alphaproteobacteria bacterium]|jgi:hypothetical protein|nr:hypothetical protein [Alphaproteobacteria bacterium]